MQETIINFFNSLILQDYIIVGTSLAFWIMFLFVGSEKLHKSYLWLILWLFIFSFTNLTLFSLNDNEIWYDSIRQFFVNHREKISILTIFLIPILAILIPLNSSIFFRLSSKKWINYISSFLLWLIYLPFAVTIFLSIIHNRFLFSINQQLLDTLNNNFLVLKFIEFFTPWKAFSFLSNYDYVFNWVIILYIFYKMTIWWIVDYIVLKLIKWLKKLLNKVDTDWGGGHSWHDDNWHSSHWDSHWHDDHWHSDNHWHDDHWHGHWH